MTDYEAMLKEAAKCGVDTNIEFMCDFTCSVMVYGAGKMGEAVIDLLKKKRVDVTGVIDRNENLKGHCVLGVPILPPEELTDSQKRNAVFLVGMSALPYYEIRDYLYSIGCLKVYNAGDYVSQLYDGTDFTNIWRFESYPSEEWNTAVQNLSLWIDDESKRDYVRACGWFSCRREDVATGSSISLNRDKYFPDFIYRAFRYQDSMLETALLDGVFVRKFAAEMPDYGKIYSCQLKPSLLDKAQIDALKKEFEQLEILQTEAGETDCSISEIRMGLMRPFTEEMAVDIRTIPIDTIMKNTPFQYLRGYSMSPMLPIIKGAREAIRKYRPILAANISHYKSDFLSLPVLVDGFLDGYRLYFRMHSYQGNDCIMYAIPNERGM